jgi:peptide/nickel transport system substrate-binding protein
MDNRFGIKDFFLFLLVAVVIVMVALAMKQYDRQYQLVRDIQEQSHDQLRELVAIHRLMEEGGSFSPTSGPSQQDEATDAFPELRKLRAEGKYNQGDWLVQNFGAPVGKITPLLAGDQYAYVIQSRVLETLAYQDTQTLKFVPLLATSWTKTDNSQAWKDYVHAHASEGKSELDIGGEPECPPAVVVDFKLRHNVTFSDGSPFSADDVVFTFNWIMNPRVDAPRDRSYLEKIKSVEKVSDDEVVFKLKVPYYMGFMVCAELEILSKRFYGAYTPEQYNNSVGLLIGTGPYRMASPTDWKPGAGRIELLRNERYWGLPTSFDRLVFNQIENDVTNLVMYGNGELDAVGLFPEQYLQIRNKHEFMDRSQLLIYQSPLTGYSFIGWNMQRAPFKDKRVRQAMTMLTDRKGICQTIYLGYSSPAPGPFEAASPQHDPNLVDWQYDPDKAKALLKELGIQDRTGSGVMTLPDGKPFSFKITYPAKSQTIDRMMQFIKDSYARAGVDAELDPVDWTVMDGRMKSRDFDAISLAWGAGSMEDDIQQMFSSASIKDQGDNFVSYSNPQFDAALRDAEYTVDDDQRMEKWHLCDRILHDDQPYTFLENPKLIRLFDKRLANISLARTGLNYVQDWVMPIPWYVPSAMQKYK